MKFKINEMVKIKTLQELNEYTLNEDNLYEFNIDGKPFAVASDYFDKFQGRTGKIIEVDNRYDEYKIQFFDGTIVDFYEEILEHDFVNYPSHYIDGKIEVIDFIEDKQLNYHRGNAVKYIARAGKKNPEKEIEDLEKAVWYLNREITRLKSHKEM